MKILNMNDIILYFIFKYKGKWNRIFEAIALRENFDNNDVNEFLNKNKSTNFISIISNNYPNELKRIYKPPFGLFIKGNSDLLNYPTKITILNNPKKEDLAFFKKYFFDNVFVVDIKKTILLKKMLDHNLKLIVVSNKYINCQKYLDIQKEIVLKNGLVICELPDNAQKSIENFYNKRLLLGMGENIISFNSVIGKNIEKIIRDDKLKIYFLNKRNMNSIGITIRNLMEIKRIIKSN